MEITIKQLSVHLIPDFLSFFDNIKFVDHPEWSACYCYSFHFTGPSERWVTSENRSSVIELIKRGIMKGYLAYHNNKPIGWCNANNRMNYDRLLKLRKLIDPSNDRICSVVCFLLHPEYRRKGISAQLLNCVIEDYSQEEYDYVEAYPDTGQFSCEKHYKGPMKIYENAGFVRIEENKDHIVVRKYLK